MWQSRSVNDRQNVTALFRAVTKGSNTSECIFLHLPGSFLSFRDWLIKNYFSEKFRKCKMELFFRLFTSRQRKKFFNK